MIMCSSVIHLLIHHLLLLQHVFESLSLRRHLTRDRDPPVRYNIIAPHTGDVLLSFHGDFAEQAVNVHNGHGQLVATTERHAFSFALDRYVQVLQTKFSNFFV